jgi:UDP-N-acetylmuramyl tripeptide synthase
MPQLGELLAGVDLLREEYDDVAINDVALLVEKVRPDSLYVACDLPWTDGHRGISRAIAKGATAIVVEQEPNLPASVDIPTVWVRDTKKAYSLICANFFGNAHRQMSLYGVTGTKGKTTTCYLLESIFKSAGFKTGLIGTIEWSFDGHGVPATLTTPEPYALHALLAEMHASGTTHVVLEVSSIGIA